MDQDDINALTYSPESAPRQAAPEFSQDSYDEILRLDTPIGNYLNKSNSLNLNVAQREKMVALIQDLHRQKEYKVETLHLAVSIADRYLSLLAGRGATCPNLVQLATISVLLAAKLEQPISPSFNRMINLLSDEHKKCVSKSNLISLERRMLTDMEFSMHWAGPIPFLERYLRLLELD